MSRPQEFWEHLAMTHMHAPRVSYFIICTVPTVPTTTAFSKVLYCTYIPRPMPERYPLYAKGILFHITFGISTNQAVTVASCSMYMPYVLLYYTKGWTAHQTDIAPTAHAASYSDQFR